MNFSAQMQPHTILGVARDADIQTIKRAYLKRARTAHPDAGGTTEEFVQVNAAYEAMLERLKPGAFDFDRAWEQNEQATDEQFAYDFMKELEERLARRYGQRPKSGQREFLRNLLLALVLTPFCSLIVGSCLCHGGKSVDDKVWSFSCALAMGVLVYLGGMVAMIGASFRAYWRAILVASVVIVLICLPLQALRSSLAVSQPVITRDVIPKWWPVD